MRKTSACSAWIFAARIEHYTMTDNISLLTLPT